MSYVLAVDLGTTFTAAAIIRDGAPQMVSLEHHGTSIPSVLHLGADRSTLAGTAAARRAGSDPARVVREFKRRIGDTIPILVGGAPYSAEQLSARLLRWVVDRVEEQEGAAPVGLAITHPANWGPYKMELLTQLLRVAEVGPSVTISEPEAAAIHYASNERVEPGEVITVYDLGGGTFDVAILRKTTDGFEMLGAPEGVERLGGIDFDAALYGYVLDQLGTALDNVPPDDDDWMAALNRLRDECTNAKEMLSSAPDAVIEAWLPSGRKQVVITRSQFEQMVEPPVVESIKAVRRALQGAHVAPSDVSRLLLVGGSSRVPLVTSMVAEELGIPVAVDTHPKHTVVLGAARFAAAASTTFRDELPTSRIVEVAEPLDDVAEAAQVDHRGQRRVELGALVDQVSALAEVAGRADLALRLAPRRAGLDHHQVRVLVAGDFKQGKSTLTNALVHTEVCPADPDFATAVPTAIRHGDRAEATVHRDTDGGTPEASRIELDEVARWTSEADGVDVDRDRVRSCSIQLPVDWLRTGVELVDMPGYGGLDATAGARVITELRQADAVLFVSDASQELTQPELDFLRTAMQHCPNVTCVMSKVDAYIDWRVIRDVNTRHLQNAELDVPIVPVSALLHLSAHRRTGTDLSHESGVDELIRIITTRIAAAAEDQQVIETAVETESTLNQLRGVVIAELDASDPGKQAGVVASLRETQQNVLDLRLDSAPWHRLVRDSFDDLRTQSLEQFEQAIRGLRTEAESVIESNDPSVIWEEFQAWLRVRTTTSVGQLYGDMTVEVSSIERRVLDRLAATEDEILITPNALSSPWVGTLCLESIGTEIHERALESVVGRSWGVAEPLLGIGGFIPGFGPVSLAVAAVAGLVYGRRAVRDRKARALGTRREQARSHLDEYIDEVRRVVEKAIDRYTSHLYRSIRDNVLQRGDELERSVTDALRQAVIAGARPESERLERLTTLRTELDGIDQISRRLIDVRDEAVKARG